MELHCPQCQHVLDQDNGHARCPSCGEIIEMKALCPDCHQPLQVLKGLRCSRLLLSARAWLDIEKTR